MTQKQILKNNLLIAKFMGWNVKSDKITGYFHPYKPNTKNPCTIYSIVSCKPEGEMWNLIGKKCKYNKSWDWLMPVVEKIGSIDQSSINIHRGTGCTDSFAWCTIYWSNNKTGRINTARSDDLKSIRNGDEQSLITAVYKAIIEFIKWYNKNNK